MKFVSFQSYSLLMKPNKKKYHHKDYDFSRLSNCFSNPDLVEDYEPPSKGEGPKKVHNPTNFETPYANSFNAVEKKSSHSTDLNPSDLEICSPPSERPSLRVRFSAPWKKPPRGKCQYWTTCLQCSRTVNCGICRNCLYKSLRYTMLSFVKKVS